MTGSFKIVQRVGDLPNFRDAYALVIDTETSGVSPYHGDRPCGIAIGDATKDVAYYIPIAHTIENVADALGCMGPDEALRSTQFKNVDKRGVADWLRGLFRDPVRLWIMHNAKFDLNMFRAMGFEIEGRTYDTMIAAYDVDGSLPSYALDEVSRHFKVGLKHAWYERVKRYLELTQTCVTTDEGRSGWNYSLLPIALLGPYAVEDIHVTRLVWQQIERLKQAQEAEWNWRLPNQGNHSFSKKELFDCEQQLVRVIADMEYRGINIDTGKALDLLEHNMELISEYSDQLYRLVGRYFNIGSWKERQIALEQVGGEVLYWMKPVIKDKDKFPQFAPTDFRGKQKSDQYTEDKRKSTGRPCWNSAALLEYMGVYRKSKQTEPFQFIRLFREVDTRQRLVNTYIRPYLRGQDMFGRLHGSFNQTGTITGRLSSSHPNMQNVARVKGNADLRAWEEFLGELEEEALSKQIRSLFLPRKGHVLVSIDYSQIEYRLAAYFSNDPIVARWYREDPNTDYHQATADLCGITRDEAKTVNFGTLYGMGPRSLAKLLGIGYADGQDLLERIFVARPALRNLIDTITWSAQKDGYIINPMGRKVMVDPKRPYAGLNYLVQGTAGDMMRIAMVRVDQLVKKYKLPILMLLQVHDELLFSMPKSHVVDWAPRIAEEMCRFPEISIPMMYEVEVGVDWGHQVTLKDWVN